MCNVKNYIILNFIFVFLKQSLASESRIYEIWNSKYFKMCFYVSKIAHDDKYWQGRRTDETLKGFSVLVKWVGMVVGIFCIYTSNIITTHYIINTISYPNATAQDLTDHKIWELGQTQRYEEAVLYGDIIT